MMDKLRNVLENNTYCRYNELHSNKSAALIKFTKLFRAMSKAQRFRPDGLPITTPAHTNSHRTNRAHVVFYLHACYTFIVQCFSFKFIFLREEPSFCFNKFLIFIKFSQQKIALT